MPDPRVARTQSHVLATVRRLLAEQRSEPLNFSVLAMEADVSRRTLYTHWGTMENVIAAVVASQALTTAVKREDMPLRERLRHFMLAGRDACEDAVSAIAMTKLMDQAAQTEQGNTVLKELTQARLGYFREQFGPITQDQYSQLAGAIYFSSFVMRTPASDEVIESLVELGMSFLEPFETRPEKITR